MVLDLNADLPNNNLARPFHLRLQFVPVSCRQRRLDVYRKLRFLRFVLHSLQPYSLKVSWVPLQKSLFLPTWFRTANSFRIPSGLTTVRCQQAKHPSSSSSLVPKAPSAGIHRRLSFRSTVFYSPAKPVMLA